MTTHNYQDLTGKPFGRWIVQYRGVNAPNGKAQWWCLCVCGTLKLVSRDSLRSGRSNSCGCLNAELVRQRGSQTKQQHKQEYRIWRNIKTRCLNSNNRNYSNYGGRGIQLEWLTFETFIADMGPRPSPQHTIERLENDGPYNKTNCIWATRDVQARNKRNNRLLTFQGKTQCLQAWAEELHIGHVTIIKRLKYGWTVERALTTPIRHHKPYRS